MYIQLLIIIFIVFQSALLSHGCIPNVNQVFSRVPPYTSKCYAAVDIKKGEEILTTYVNPCFSTATRRKHLREGWFFECVCRRCMDPTENDSFLGAIICLKCQENNKEANVFHR